MVRQAFFLGLISMLSCCSEIDTKEKAHQYYEQYRDDFIRAVDLAKAQDAIVNVSRAYSSIDSLNRIERNRDFTKEDQRIYFALLSILKRLDLDRIRIVYGVGGSPLPVEVVSFVVWSRGVGGDTEAVLIEYTKGEPLSEEGCEQTIDDNWYVCRYF